MAKKILVIEDTAEVRENIAEILESEGFEVFKAENGDIGINMAERIQPDLILCDIMMPGKDGYEVLEELRKKVLTSTTPFIFLTAKNTREDLRRGMALGADDYISKPFTIDELITSVNTRLKKAEEFRKRSEAKLEELTRNLGMPVASVIHEPLRAIIGFSQMVMTEYPNMEKPEIAELMSLVYKAGMKLNKIVRKTMLFYELEALAYKNKEVEDLKKNGCENPSEIIRRSAQQMALNMNRSEDLFMVTDFNAKARISCEHLKTIVDELVENALLYSPRRSHVKLVAGADHHRLQISVNDEGIGMTDKQIASIGAFTQFNKEFNQQEGLGLGLTLVKNILSVFDGEFHINSTPGVGTTVKVSIPLA
ncbi:MAG: hybrid sensor histidine kinase/response regulator [Bacteroidales bacterium]